MQIKLDFTRSSQENGNHYYEEAKRLEGKIKRAEEATSILRAKIEEAKSKESEGKTKITKIQDKKWYEKFHWFFTSGNLLAIGGRDAQQNELLNSRYFEDHDLFFHANIFGASVVILKEGINASKEDKEECAQFSASYSSAWNKMQGEVDVYCMKRDQVSKSTNKGSLGTGSFLLKGEREWYRNTGLKLVALIEEEKFEVLPYLRFMHIDNQEHIKKVIIDIGKMQKSDAAKKIALILKYDDINTIMQQLPAGTFSLTE